MENTGSNVLFNTDFSTMDGLMPLVGKWTLVDGKLVAPTNASGTGTGGSIVFGDPGWTDVQLALTATLSSGPGLGVFFRTDGQRSAGNTSGVNAGYSFQIDPGAGNRFVVRKWVNGAETAPIATAPMSAEFLATMYTKPHDIRISAVGTHIMCFVDGVKVLDFNDATYASGAAGVRAWYGSSVSFLDAQATGGGGAAGAGDPSRGDFAYAHDARTVTFGLVGWMAGGTAWVVQPLK